MIRVFTKVLHAPWLFELTHGKHNLFYFNFPSCMSYLILSLMHYSLCVCRPWHVFVDLAPDADVDFEVAATFDVEPTVEDVHQSIVECIEGSELEEELVAQQMQAALESGQLEKVNEMLEFGNIDDVQGNNDEDDDFDNTDDKQTK